MYEYASMSEFQCPRCFLPLIELDAYGERLRGCLNCNSWQVITTSEVLAKAEWRELPEEDIAALRGLGSASRYRCG